MHDDNATGAPPNAPLDCPRVFDESSGPRRCPHDGCPLHLLHSSRTGRWPAQWREHAQRQCEDTCAVDVAERARTNELLGLPKPTLREVAVLMGVSRQAVFDAEQRALAKLRRKRTTLLAAA